MTTSQRAIRRSGNLLRQIRPYLRVLPAARRNRLDLVRWLRRRPQILAGAAGYEMALLASARVDPHLKQLAELKAAALVACEFCLDIGSALAAATGVSEAQLRDLPNFRDSGAFNPGEKLVLELAEAMSRTPADVPDNQIPRSSAAGSAQLGPCARPVCGMTGHWCEVAACRQEA